MSEREVTNPEEAMAILGHDGATAPDGSPVTTEEPEQPEPEEVTTEPVQEQQETEGEQP